MPFLLPSTHIHFSHDRSNWSSPSFSSTTEIKKKYKSTDDWILTARFLTQIWNFLYETKQAAISLISYSHALLWSRNNSVDNAARLLARRPSNFGSILGSGNRYFSTPKRPYRPWDALSFPFSGYQRLFPQVQRPGPEADHSPTMLTIRGAIPPFPPIRLHGVYMGKLYLPLRTATARQTVVLFFSSR